MIFGVKLDAGFTWKERIVADGHEVYTPTSMTYAYVVSTDSIIIAPLIDDINGLDVQYTYVQNAYLNTTPKECA